MFSKDFRQYLREHRVARLASLNKDETVHIVPIVFANDSRSIYFAIDKKPKKTEMLKRLWNIERNPQVTLLLDDYDEDWNRLSYAIIYSKAKILRSQRKEKTIALFLLKEKYSQYRIGGYLPENSSSTIVIRLTPSRIVQWSAKSALKSSLI